MHSRARSSVFALQLFTCLFLATLPAAAQPAPLDPAEHATAPGGQCRSVPPPGHPRTLFLVDHRDKYGFIDNTGKIVIPLQFSSACDFSEGLAAVAVGKKYGFIDTTGKLIVPPTYSYVHSFHEGFARVQAGKKWGYLDKTGHMAIPAQYDSVEDFFNGLAAVEVEDKPEYNMGHRVYKPGQPTFKLGFIDTTGQMVIPLAYRDLEMNRPPVSRGFSDGLLTFRIDRKWGAMDTTGKVVIEPQYLNPLRFSDGLASIETAHEHGWLLGYIDTTGQIVIPPQYPQAQAFSEGLAAVKIDDKWGFIDKTGDLVIPAQFTTVEKFRGGFAAVRAGDKWGVIDKTGKAVVPFQFQSGSCPDPSRPNHQRSIEPPQFSEGLANVSIDCKWGFADTTGQLAIPPGYEQARPFSDGMAPIQVGSKWGYIDKSGRLVIQARYDVPGDFSGGLAQVMIDNKSGFLVSYIDKTGKCVWGPELVTTHSIREWLAVPLIFICPYCVA